MKNPHAIEWRDEADKLWKMGVKIYAVQCHSNQKAAYFYKALAGRTVGTYVELQNFNIVKDMILSICFREFSSELMHGYEKEIIAEGRMTKAMHTMIRQVSKEIPLKEVVIEEKEEEEEEEKEPSLKRGLSIADYFSPFAGLTGDEISSEKVDVHSNPEGREYDLGVEKTFKTFSIILYSYNDKEESQDPSTLFFESVKALGEKGFDVYLAKDEDDFLEKLPSFDQVWIASADRDNCKDSKKLIEALEKFHKAGKGIALWADIQNVQASLFLEHLCGVTLEEGTTSGKFYLKVGDVSKPKNLAKHLVTTGLTNLFEGCTTSFPKNYKGKINVIGNSSKGKPCIFTIEEPKTGPILVDCGFTKLYPNYWGSAAGTPRYVRNIGVWLLGLDWRTSIGAPLQGDISEFLSK